jgi:hypothetical protein
MGFIADASSASKGSGKTEIPDYGRAAMQTSKGTRPNWSGPTGGQEWTYDANGQPTMKVTTPNQGTFDALGQSMQQAASMDPSQARDQAVNQNLDFGMSRLQPLLQQQNQAFTGQMANSGLQAGTEAYDNANRALGVKQSDAFNSMYTNALNQGSEAQRTNILQQMVPFQQESQLANATNSHPYMGEGADLTKATEDWYKAQKNNNNVDQANMQKATNSWGSMAGKLGGK